jgi:hypothetical protein
VLPTTSTDLAQTRITTKYKIPNLAAAKYQKPAKRKRADEGEDKDEHAPKVPKAVLVLKTYDPESGVVLKFKTDRAADVGRLITGLGRLGRHMVALPEKAEGEVIAHVRWQGSALIRSPADTVMEDAAAAEPAKENRTAPSSKDAQAVPAQQAPSAGGGGKKKKKGKK